MKQPSLRNYSRQLASQLGLKPDEVYGRQRALSDAGLLIDTERKGRGGGAALNAENLAALTIAILCAHSRSDVEAYAKEYMDLPIIRQDSSVLAEIGYTLFDFLVHAIKSPMFSDHIEHVTVSRSRRHAIVQWTHSVGETFFLFSYEDFRFASFEEQALMSGGVIYKISSDYAELFPDDSEGVLPKKRNPNIRTED